MVDLSRKTKQNSLTSPELLKDVLKENVDLKIEFLDYLRGVNRSPSTIHGYDNDLDIFFTWNLLYNKNCKFKDVRKRDLVRYQSWLINENGNSSSRVRRLRAAISSLSNYIENIIADEDDDYSGFRSIVKKIEAPPLEKTREKTVWTEEEIKALLTALVDMKQHEKACYLALAVYSGRRKSELFRYRVDFFVPENLIADGKLYFTPKIKTKGRGREGKSLNTYVLANDFQPYFDLWMAERKALGVTSDWLFPDPADMSKHRNESIANSWAETFSRLSGRSAYVHSYRHFCCSQFLRAGVPESVVVEIFGWTSADMLKIYDDRPSSDQVDEAFSKLM